MQRAIYCENGHWVETIGGRQISVWALRDTMDSLSEETQPFCTKCGAKTLSCCTHCNTAIRYRHVGDRAAYCSGCGKPFPWIEVARAAAIELADELEELNAE